MDLKSHIWKKTDSHWNVKLKCNESQTCIPYFERVFFFLRTLRSCRLGKPFRITRPIYSYFFHSKHAHVSFSIHVMTARHRVQANKRSWLKKSITTPTLRARDFSCAISDIVQVFIVTHIFGPRPIPKHPATRKKTWNIWCPVPRAKNMFPGFSPT